MSGWQQNYRKSLTVWKLGCHEKQTYQHLCKRTNSLWLTDHIHQLDKAQSVGRRFLHIGVILVVYLRIKNVRRRFENVLSDVDFDLGSDVEYIKEFDLILIFIHLHSICVPSVYVLKSSPFSIVKYNYTAFTDLLLATN